MRPGSFAVLARYILSIVAINGLFAALLVGELGRTGAEGQAQAKAAAESAAKRVEYAFALKIARVDMGLLALRDLLGPGLADGSISRTEANRRLEALSARLPELEAVRVARSDGLVVFGPDLDPSSSHTIADRDYFARLRDADGDILAVSCLMTGRVSGKAVLNVARRLAAPDGSFAGVVFAALSLESLAADLDAVDLGSSGAILILGADDSLLLSWPEDAKAVEDAAPASPAGLVGRDAGLPEDLGPLSSGVASRLVDGEAWAIASSGSYPIAAAVRLETSDFLGAYRRTRTSAFISFALCLFGTCLASLFVEDQRRRRTRYTETILREKATAQDYLDIAQIMIGVLDPQGRIVLLNRRGCAMLGWEEEELVGKDWVELCVPPAFREARKRRYLGYLGTDGPTDRPESPLLRRDGEIRFVSLKGIPTHDASGALTGFIFSGEDVTEYRRSREREDLVRGVLEMVASGAGLPLVGRRIAETIEGCFPGDRCAIALRGTDGDAFILAAAPSLPDSAFDGGSRSGRGRFAREILAGHSVYVDNYEENPELAEAVALHGLGWVRSSWARPIRAESGEVLGAFSVYRDRPGPASDAEIALFLSAIESLRFAIERRGALDSLRESESRYRSIFDLSAAAIWEEDISALRGWLREIGVDSAAAVDARIAAEPGFLTAARDRIQAIDCNQATLDLYGASSKEGLLASLGHTMDPETLGDFRNVLLALVEGRTTMRMDTTALKLSGERIHVSLGVHIPEAGSPFQSILVSVFDTTEMVRASRALERAVRDREVLLRELQHRVKNSLLLVSSLLSLDEGRILDPGARLVFAEAQGRIIAMSAVYEKLYRSEDLTTVDMRPYVTDLAWGILGPRNEGGTEVSLGLEVEEISLDARRAIPLGLVINELLTNALKYAFRGRTEGKLSVEFGLLPDGRYRLAVLDDGVGLPPGFEPSKVTSLGTQLVLLLAGQLGGTATWSGEGGTRVELLFPS